KLKTHSFFLDEIVFMRIGGHFAGRPPVNHGHILGAAAFGDGGAVDGGIPCSDYDHVSANLQIVAIQFALLDIFESIEDVCFAGDAQVWRCAQAQAEKNCVEL